MILKKKDHFGLFEGYRFLFQFAVFPSFDLRFLSGKSRKKIWKDEKKNDKIFQIRKLKKKRYNLDKKDFLFAIIDLEIPDQSNLVQRIIFSTNLVFLKPFSQRHDFFIHDSVGNCSNQNLIIENGKYIKIPKFMGHMNQLNPVPVDIFPLFFVQTSYLSRKHRNPVKWFGKENGICFYLSNLKNELNFPIPLGFDRRSNPSDEKIQKFHPQCLVNSTPIFPLKRAGLTLKKIPLLVIGVFLKIYRHQPFFGCRRILKEVLGFPKGYFRYIAPAIGYKCLEKEYEDYRLYRFDFNPLKKNLYNLH